MAKALRLQLQAWGGLDSVESADSEGRTPHPPAAVPERAFAALQSASYRKLERLQAAAAAIEPSDSASVAGPSEREFDWIWAEVERLVQFSARHSLPPRARNLRRWRGRLLAGLSAVLIVCVSFQLWGRPRVQASASYSEAYSAAHAIDGSEDREWLLPDGANGWLDVMLPYARTVSRVRLINSRNPGFADRATRAVRVTAFSKTGPPVSAESAFKRLSVGRTELDLELRAQGVSRVRVEVLSHFKLGGGLAEVIVE